MIEQYVNNTPNVLSMKERQISYEMYYDKRQARELIRDRFSEVLKQFDLLSLDNKQNDLMCDVIGIVALRTKRTSINAVMEMLADRQDIELSVNNLMKCIVKLIQANILHGSMDSKNRLYIESKFTLKDEDLELLGQYQYKIPMLVKPLSLNQKGNNRGNGYYLNGRDSLILNVHHTEDIDHKVLERLNNIPLCINISFMKNIRNSWKCMNSREDLHKNTEKNFTRFEKAVMEVSAIMINNGNKFYFTHKYDKRGRIYCCGYQLNYQGNSYAKAQLELANKQLITEEVNFFE